MSDAGFVIEATPPFDFTRTVLSHGWRQLPPFSWDAQGAILGYVYESSAGEVWRLNMRARAGGVHVSSRDCPAPSRQQEQEMRAAVTRMLNLPWDASAFYAAMRAHDGYEWLEAQGWGRLLLAPSLWEDMAKVLLTTNCSWAQTLNMCRQLCRLGAPHPEIAGGHAFPTPERIAALAYDSFTERVRAGYRSAYLYDLARKIADREIDPHAWLALDGDTFYRAVKSLRGFGDYAAGTLSRMVGHCDKVAIDSACRAMFAPRYNGGVKADDIAIKAQYGRFGEWRGLVAWLDVMRHYGA